MRWIEGAVGPVEIGHGGEGFAFDCEGPRHAVLLTPHALADRLVTNAEWLAFIDGVGVGTDVRLSGIKIGTVTSTELDQKMYRAIVRMNIKNDVKLPEDSSVKVGSESLLGGKYLSLQPGGDETLLQPGQTITITQSSVSLEELLGKFIFSITNVKPGEAQPGAQKP